MQFIGGRNVDLNNVKITFDDAPGELELGTVWKVDSDMNLLQVITDTDHEDGIAQFADCESIARYISDFYCCDHRKPEGLSEFLGKIRKL